MAPEWKTLPRRIARCQDTRLRQENRGMVHTDAQGAASQQPIGATTSETGYQGRKLGDRGLCRDDPGRGTVQMVGIPPATV